MTVPHDSVPESFSDLFEFGRKVHLDGTLWTAVNQGSVSYRYDNRARLYDLIIGSGVYNRLAWGLNREAYSLFAARALNDSRTGWYLDAGCGTMVHTRKVYRDTGSRPIVAVDLSRGMLLRAHQQLVRFSGARPYIHLLQADLLDLPFRKHTFTTILCMGMLHLFEHPETLLVSLKKCLAPGGNLFISFLAQTGRYGDSYLDFLYGKGEVARPLSKETIETLFKSSFASSTIHYQGNMVFAVGRDQAVQTSDA